MRISPIAMSALVGVSLWTSANSASADELHLEIEIPKLNVAEYHRPYVAVWIETVKGKHQADLSLWYDDDMKDDEGTKWLKDLRRWWRRSGRSLSFPVDALSSATRAVGSHQLKFDGDQTPLDSLAAGNYHLMVEVSREVGGREVLTLPFSWPAKGTQNIHKQGEHELGLVKLNIAR